MHRSLARVHALWRADAVLLVSLLIVFGGLSTFAVIADAVSAHATQRLDDALMRDLRDRDDLQRPIGPWWLPDAMRDVTALGSATVLTFVVLAVCGALVARRQRHALALLLAATIGGRLLNVGLKAAFARPRPSEALHLTVVRSASFPSGHAMDSATIYLTLAALLATLVQGRRLKLYFVGLAFACTFLVGVSRVYLGVHYPSDVVAGWTAGLAWATLCWIVARALQRRGRVEPAS